MMRMPDDSTTKHLLNTLIRFAQRMDQLQSSNAKIFSFLPVILTQLENIMKELEQQSQFNTSIISFNQDLPQGYSNLLPEEHFLTQGNTQSEESNVQGNPFTGHNYQQILTPVQDGPDDGDSLDQFLNFYNGDTVQQDIVPPVSSTPPIAPSSLEEEEDICTEPTSDIGVLKNEKQEALTECLRLQKENLALKLELAFYKVSSYTHEESNNKKRKITSDYNSNTRDSALSALAAYAELLKPFYIRPPQIHNVDDCTEPTYLFQLHHLKNHTLQK